MRIWFDDGSFVDLVNETTEQDKVATLIICGIDGKKVTMSSAELDIEQAKKMCTTLSEIITKEKENG